MENKNTLADGTAAKVIDFRVRLPNALRPNIETPIENKQQYDAVLNVVEKLATGETVDQLLTQMDQAGIDQAIVHAEYEAGDQADALNRAVVDLCEQHPQRFRGIGTISMENICIKKALKQIDDCIEMKLLGLSLQPAFFGLSIDDKRLYPIYAKAMENNLLVALHTGINYSTNRPMSAEHPLLIDQLCCDFPDLTVVASHAAWPWVNEMVAVARRHPNVYMEFGGLAPKYIAEPGSGWEVMHRFMNSVLSKQILYGTDWPTMDHQRTLNEWREMGLKPAVLEALLGENAKRLMDRFGESKQ